MGFLMYKSKNRVKGSLIWHLKLSYMKEKNLNPYSVPSLLSFWISFGRLVPALLRNSANSFRLPQGHRLWCKVGKLPGEFFSYSHSRLGNCPILLYLFQFLSFQKNQNSTISENFGKWKRQKGKELSHTHTSDTHHVYFKLFLLCTEPVWNKWKYKIT